VNAHWDHDWLDYETCPLRKTEVHSIYHHYLCDAEHAWLVGNESCTSEYIQSICLSNPCVLCLTIFIPQQFLIINEIHWKKPQQLILRFHIHTVTYHPQSAYCSISQTLKHCNMPQFFCCSVFVRHILHDHYSSFIFIMSAQGD